jgi:hypothetical protein
MNGKYIIFERDGLEFPVLFPNHFVTHNEIHGTFSDKPVAAGFWCLSIGSDNITVSTYGESVSLKLKSRKDLDENLINKQLGLTD